jgi:hypothetical protein
VRPQKVVPLHKLLQKNPGQQFEFKINKVLMRAHTSPTSAMAQTASSVMIAAYWYWNSAISIHD